MKNFRKFVSSNKQISFRLLMSMSVVMLFGIMSLFLIQPSAQMQDANQELAEKAVRLNNIKLSPPTEFDVLKAQAQPPIQTLNGTLAASDPTFNRPNGFNQGGNCVLSGFATAAHYKAVPFTVNFAGNYSISLLPQDGATVTPPNADTFIVLYGQGGFNPANPCANAITANDDFGFSFLSKVTTTTPLAAGNYTLVVTSFNNEPSNLPFTFSAVLVDASVPAPVNNNLIKDGGFEQNAFGLNPFWNSTSIFNLVALCDFSICSTGGGTAPPRTGNGWVLFDAGSSAPETGSASQTVVIPAGTFPVLNYYLRMGRVNAPFNSTLRVQVDGTTVQTITESSTADTDYNFYSVNLEQFANGGSHVIRFLYNRPAGSTTPDAFVLDDVTLIANPNPMADLAVSIVDSPDPVNAGSNIRYSIFVNNNGPNFATDVVLSTAVPANTTFVSLTQTGKFQFTCTTPAAGGTGNITCTNPSLILGRQEIVLTVRVNPGTPNGTVITRNATVSAQTVDPVPGNNTATAMTTVNNSGNPPPCPANTLDFNGDRRADFVVFRPSNNFWFVNPSSAANNLMFSGQPFGTFATDVLTPGDYDGDGITDYAVWRRTTGTFFVLRSSTNTVVSQQFGQNGDEPVARDYDGDCRTDYAVVRRMNGMLFWYMLNSSNNSFRGEQFGSAGDVTAPGDYDGDGRYDLAVYRGVGDQQATFYVKRSSDNTFTASQFGLGSDLVVPGDYDGDRRTDFAVVRTGTEYQWYIWRSSNDTLYSAQLGSKSDLPTQNDYDGDGRTDISVYRQQNSTFYVIRTADLGLTFRTFGVNGDYPVANFDTH